MIKTLRNVIVAEKKAILLALFISLEGAMILPHALIKSGFLAGPTSDLLDLLAACVLGIALFLSLAYVGQKRSGVLPATKSRRIVKRVGALLPLLLVLLISYVLFYHDWWRLSDPWPATLIVNSLVLAVMHGWVASRASWPVRIALIALAAGLFYVYANILYPIKKDVFFEILVIQTGALFVLQAEKLPRTFWLLCLAYLLSMYWTHNIEPAAFDRYRFDNLLWPSRLPAEMILLSTRELLGTLGQASWFGGSSVLPLQGAATQWALPSHLEKFGWVSLTVLLVSVFFWLFLVRPRCSAFTTNSRRSVCACSLWLGLLLITVINVFGSLVLIQGFDSRVPLFAADLSLILAAWMLMALNAGDVGSPS